MHVTIVYADFKYESVRIECREFNSSPNKISWRNNGIWEDYYVHSTVYALQIIENKEIEVTKKRALKMDEISEIQVDQLKQELIKEVREVIDDELRIRVKDEVAMEVRRIFRDMGRS